jgi:hypothetical protein
MAATASERISRIRALDIPSPSTTMLGAARMAVPAPAPTTAGQASGNVVAGGLTSFVAGVSADHGSASLRTCLLAQLAADKALNRFDKSQLMSWYKKYQEVLGMCGWTLQDFNFKNFQASGSTLTINNAIINIVAAFATGAEVAVVKATLDALKNLSSDSPWYKLWDRSSHSDDGGNFQVAAASDTTGKKNSLVMKISAYAFFTTETTTRFLWTGYHSSDVQLQYAAQIATLDEDVYGQVSDTILTKLGNHASTGIANLSL